MSSKKIVSITGGRTPAQLGEPNEAVIEMAREVLARAQCGDVQGLAVAMFHSDLTHTAHSVGEETYGLIGALETVKYKIIHDSRD